MVKSWESCGASFPSVILLLIFLLVNNVTPQSRQFSSENQIRRFADALFVDKDYLRAIEEYSRLTKFQKNDSIVLKIGYSNMEMGYIEEAIKSFGIIKDDSPLKDLRDYFLLKSFYISNQDSIISTTNLDYESNYLQNNKKLILFSELRSNPSTALLKSSVVFNDSEMNIVNGFIQRKLSPDYRDEIIAGVLSTLFPGAGKIYCKKPEEGIIAFILTLGSAYISYTNFQAGHNFRGWLFGGLTAFFYAGNIYGSVRETQNYNLKINVALNNEISVFLQDNNYFAPKFPK